MRKVWICSRSAETKSKIKLMFEYYLTADELSDESGEIEVEAYGVGVSSGTDEANVRALTMNACEAERIADIMANHLVTPSTLCDIIYDIFAA